MPAELAITSAHPVIVHAGQGNWVFVKIETDAGITGIGEGSLKGKARTIAAGIEDAGRYLVGRSPLDPPWIWDLIYEADRFHGGPILTSVMSAIDMACWDIVGKFRQQPVWQLLGQPCRDKVQLYGRLCRSGSPQENLAGLIGLVREQGYQAIKAGFHVTGEGAVDQSAIHQACVAQFTQLREALGDGVDVCLDTHAMLAVENVIALAGDLQPLALAFLEEPVPPEDIEGLRSVRQHTSVPLATGERLMTRFGFLPLIEEELVDIIQPDICHCGGVTELKRIADMAATRGIKVSPHNPSSHSELATMASIHVDACISNFAMQEHPAEVPPWRYEIFEEQIEIENGYACLPDRPGLGLTLRDDVVSQHPYQPYTRQCLFNPDGSPART
jgi:galactonate dehydratase